MIYFIALRTFRFIMNSLLIELLQSYEVNCCWGFWLTGSNLAPDTLLVRSTVNEAERPASTVVSSYLPSTNMDRPEMVLEKMKADVPTYDMNHSSGYIRMRHTRLNDVGLDVHQNSTLGVERSAGGSLQLLKPKRLVEGDTFTKPIQQKPEQETLTSRSKVVTVTTDSTTSSVTAASTVVSVPLKVASDLPRNAVKELPKKVAEVFPAKLTVEAVKELPQKVAELPAIAVLTTTQVLRTQIVEPIVEGLPDKVVEQVSQAVEQVVDLQLQVADSVSSVAEQVAQIGQTLVDQVTEALPESVVEQASQVTSTAVQVTESVTSKAIEVTEVLSSTAAQVSENVTTKAVQVTESVTSTAAQVSSQIVEFLSVDDNEDSDSEDEFEAFKPQMQKSLKACEVLKTFKSSKKIMECLL